MNTSETSSRRANQHLERVGIPSSEEATNYERRENLPTLPKAREDPASEWIGDPNAVVEDSVAAQSLTSFFNKPLPEIPSADFSDFMDDSKISMFMDSSYVVEGKVNKRASNVMKLAQENEKLQAELQSMADKLDAMERRRAQLAAKEEKPLQEPSS